MPAPFFQITLSSGTDISAGIRSRNISLDITVTDGKGADTVNISVDDQDGSFGEPEPGTQFSIIAGYLGEARDFGVFVVDEVTSEGWPMKITIAAQTVDVTGPAKQQATQGFPKKDYPTFGDVFGKLAADAGLALSIAGSLAAKANEYVGQAAEDPVSFATRIAEKINGTVSVKSGKLVVSERNSGMAASGAAMTPIGVFVPGNAVSYSRSKHGKPAYSTVKATWMDRKENKLKEVVASTGVEGPEYVMRSSKQVEEDAQDQADSKAKELAAATETATFTINGTPSATAGAPVIVSGIKPTVDGTWIAKSVTHSFTADGPYTTTLECEKKV